MLRHVAGQMITSKAAKVHVVIDQGNSARISALSGMPVQRVENPRADEGMAASETIAFLEQWVPAGASPMCGNSICQDRRFMARHMPELERYFHYRNLDVSSLKILAQRWRPDVAAGFSKRSVHLALDDIRDSIEELRHYRDHFLIAQPVD